jgi:hypothetical protein
MVSLHSTVARHLAVQRIQIVRQQRVGKLLVQVRQRAHAVATSQKRFSETLATVAALKCGNAGKSGAALRSDFAPRLDAMVHEACSGLAKTEIQKRKLVARENYLSLALGQAKRAQERGRESQIEASHTITRLRETADLSEVQARDEEVGYGGIAFIDEASSLVDEVASISNDFCIEKEYLSLNHQKGAVSCEPINGGALQSSIQEVTIAARQSESSPQKPTTVRHLPPPIPSASIREVVVSAKLPGSSGTIEVAHSPQQGVTISLRTRANSVTLSSRRAFQGLRDSLQQEGVRIAAIDLLDEEA